MRTTLNTRKLAHLIQAKQGATPLRELSDEICRTTGNISPATLSRVTNFRPPDMETFLILCDWLEVPPTEFFEIAGESAKANESKAEQMALRILSDQDLSPKTASALAHIVRMVYKEDENEKR